MLFKINTKIRLWCYFQTKIVPICSVSILRVDIEAFESIIVNSKLVHLPPSNELISPLSLYS